MLEQIIELILLILGGCVGLLTLTSVLIYGQRDTLLNADRLLQETDDIKTIGAALDKMDAATLEWVNRNKLQYVNSYKFQSLFLHAWQVENSSTYLGIMQLPTGKLVISFNTGFSNDVSLETGNTSSVATFPKPEGVFVEIFSNAKIDTLWEKHGQAIRFLKTTCGLVEESSPLSLKDQIIASEKRNGQYAISLPLWYVRGAIRLLLTRFLMANKSIEAQYLSKKLLRFNS